LLKIFFPLSYFCLETEVRENEIQKKINFGFQMSYYIAGIQVQDSQALVKNISV
jgi:hypothetical protein